MNEDLVLLCHQGIGDFIGLVGAIRYLASRHRRLTLIVESRRLRNVELLFQAVNNVDFFAFEVPERRLYAPLHNLPSISNFCVNKRVLAIGFHRHPRTSHAHCKHNQKLTDQFYCDLGLDTHIKHTWFELPITANAERLLALIGDTAFCFVHQQSSEKTMRIPTQDLSIFIVDPCENHYAAEDERHALAEQFVGHPVVDYHMLIQRAQQIRVIDSCFACMALRMPLKAEQKVYYSRFSQAAGDVDASWRVERVV